MPQWAFPHSLVCVLMKKIRGQRQTRRTGRLYFLLMIGLLIAFMTVQLVMLYDKSEEYASREADLKQQLSEQQEKQKELSDYETYTKSEEYTKNMAKSKLGLVSPNEIIFRER